MKLSAKQPQKPTSSYELIGFFINALIFLGRFLVQIAYINYSKLKQNEYNCVSILMTYSLDFPKKAIA